MAPRRRRGIDRPNRAPGFAHLITVGTTMQRPDRGDDIIGALIEDLKPQSPARVVVLCTGDSRSNAERLIAGVGLDSESSSILELKSAQSLDEAFLATSAAVTDLERRGFPARRIIVHYTAGTKVMSGGMVLAAVSRGCESLRYLYSQGPGKTSTPVITSARSVRSGRDLRLARDMMRELRFRAASDILGDIDTSLLSEEERQTHKALTLLAPGFAGWDSFRVSEFLESYQQVENARQFAPEFALSPEAIKRLRKIARAETTEGIYPIELCCELFSSAIRRLMERRNDDALTRLYRAAELFAQSLLWTKFRISTDDLDVRKVPPRNRVSFEALRRLDDTKIKLGLRKSFELLAHLDHPVGHAFLQTTSLQDALERRRQLVLAHGTQPARGRIVLELLDRLQKLFALEYPDFRQIADGLQFPWINNERVLARVRQAIDDPKPVRSVEEDVEKPVSELVVEAQPARKRRRRRGGRRGARK